MRIRIRGLTNFLILSQVYLAFFFFLAWSQLSAQKELSLKNGSFEKGRIDTVRGQMFFTMKGWLDWGSHAMFPTNTPPDIHSAKTNYWNVTKSPQHGATFVGLVTRPDSSFECIAQRLAKPLESGAEFTFTIFLCQDSLYMSPTSLSGFTQPVSFANPTVLKLWGTNTPGQLEEVLGTSDSVLHQDWRKYSFTLKPGATYKFLVISAHYPEGFVQPTAGHVLIDNASLVRRD